MMIRLRRKGSGVLDYMKGKQGCLERQEESPLGRHSVQSSQETMMRVWKNRGSEGLTKKDYGTSEELGCVVTL